MLVFKELNEQKTDLSPDPYNFGTVFSSLLVLLTGILLLLPLVRELRASLTKLPDRGVEGKTPDEGAIEEGVVEGVESMGKSKKLKLKTIVCNWNPAQFVGQPSHESFKNKKPFTLQFYYQNKEAEPK